MKKTIKTVSLALCLVSVLCACGNIEKRDAANNERLHTADETSFEEWQAMSMEMAVIENALVGRDGCYPIWNEETTQTAAGEETTQATSQADEEAVSDTVKVSEDFSFGWKGAMCHARREVWQNKNVYLQRISSDQTSIEIPAYAPEYGEITWYCSTIGFDCPNLTEITIGEGYEMFILPSSDSDFYRVQTLTLPADFLGFAHAPGYVNSVEYRATPLDLPFSPNFIALREIHIPGAEIFDPIWSENGMLFATHDLDYDIQHVLVCLPQDYPCEDGTVVLPEYTEVIQAQAVYRCRNIKRLIISEYTEILQKGAIMATPANPLTVVCKEGSAADEYVKQYGKEYHLTVEYLP